MKHILFYLTVLFSVQAFGVALPEPTFQVLRNKNLISNPGFENGLAQWTKTGGTSALDKTTQIGGVASARWTPSAAGQYFQSALHTLQPGTKGKNGFASCAVQVPSGSSTYKLQVVDGSANVIAERPITNSTVADRTHILFQFPSSGQVRLRLTSVAAAEPAVGIDNCFMGLLLDGERTVTTAQKLALNPVEGLQVYDSTIHQVQVYNGSSWVQLGGGGGGGGGINLLTLNGGNADAESGGIGGLTASGGTLTAQTATPLNGLASFQFASTAIGQYVDSTAYAVPAGFAGRKCQVHFPLYTSTNSTSATTDFDVQVIDGSNNVLVDRAIPVTTAPNTGTVFQAFDCPAPGVTLKYRVINVSGTAGTIVWDDAFLGQGRNTINTFGPIITAWTTGTCTSTWGAAATVNCSYRRVGDVAEVQQNLTLTAAPTGTLLLGIPSVLTIDLSKYPATSGALPRQQLGYGQGAVVSAYFFSVNQLTSGSTSQVEPTVIQTNGAEAAITPTLPATFAAGNSLQFFYRIPISGWTAERAPVEGNTYDTVGWRVDATILAPSGGINSIQGQQPAYVAFTGTGMTLTNSAGANVLQARIACADGTVGTGQTCDPSGESAGITFDLPKAGDAKVCAAFSHFQSPIGSTQLDTYFRLAETANQTSQTVLQVGKEVVGTYAVNLVQTTPIKLCENFTFTSAGTKTVRLFVASQYTPANGGINTNGNVPLIDGGGYGRGMHFTVEPINESMPAPVFASLAAITTANSTRVDGGQTGMKAISAYFTGNSSVCSVASSNGGSWLSSSTRSAGAVCQINFTPGFWTQTPICTASVNQGTALSWGGTGVNSASTSVVYVTRTNSSSTYADVDFQLICVGR